MGRGGVAAVVTAAMSALAAPASGQGSDAEVHIDQLQPPSAESPFTRAEGPFDGFDAGFAAAARIVGDYAFQPLGDQGGDDEVFPVEHALLFHLGASIAAIDWLLLEASFPFAVYESGQPSGALAAGEAHVGDLRLGGLLRPVESKQLDLSFGVRVWVPTGQREAYLGGDDHFTRFEAVAAAAGEIDVLRYGCTFGIAPLFFAGRDGDRLAASCAAQFKVAPLVALGVEPHVAVFSFSGAGQASEHVPGLGDAEVLVQFEPIASASVTIGDFQLAFAGGVGIGDAPGTPTGRALAWFSYAPSPKREPRERKRPVVDSDDDGVVDAEDDCPSEPGTRARRGCPAPRDLDGDGIVDGDACPEEAGARYLDARANGCPDSDGDRVADPADTCPSEPGAGGQPCPRFARLAAGAFVFTPPLQFAPGTAQLGGTARPALLEVARTLRASPAIAKIRVAFATLEAPAEVVEQRLAALTAALTETALPPERYTITPDDALPANAIAVTVEE
jgi:hypothetical protein